MTVVIAHLSDTHLDGGPRSAERTRAVLRYLDGLPYDLDLVLVTGDVADHATPEEYAQARELLASRHPVLIGPGNHDGRAAFRRHLLGLPESSAPVDQVHRGEGFVLALCDSSVPGRHEGRLEPATVDWLAGVLAETPAELPVLVAFHHPPVELHTPYVDPIRLLDPEPLAALATRHPNLVAFLCGHAHTAAATTFAGRPLLVAPGVVSTLRLPWEPQEGPEHHVHLDLPPAVAFHLLEPDGRLTTHFRAVPVPGS
ncbi:metallophosphoesterase [Kitasatospora sp. MMS16-BH015]|uniref:metallophosphoesterase n=1 Tax=Kitasatospora sp. MMS16-BH015 TaxID=2018025 RepID=UPI000CA351D7|nr:metallophosphoesterase [Kitasatospora sp. MMS16-BH015]AUG82199.1 metallophosphoesterase [Kitasatospora sp. MMS16-BH015]